MEFVGFEKAFDISNQLVWNRASKTNLKPELVLAYEYIDMCAELISRLLATISDQTQQLVQINAMSMQVSVDTENKGLKIYC